MPQHLLTPVRLGALELKNRVVMAPLTRCRCDNPGYVPTEMMARHYA
ncbi:MAG: alkene reductase, partial [Azonexus sp.]